MRLNEFRNNFLLPEEMEWPNILSNGVDTSNKTDYGIPLPPALKVEKKSTTD
jgi:(S)-2-hydroxy-acid oxidase